jgi:hypothetical protein
MDICPPSFTAAALFVAFILYDMTQRDFQRIPGRLFFGIIAIVLLNYLCQKGAEKLAWILLGFPILLVLIGVIFSPRYYQEDTRIPKQPCDEPKPCCQHRPCGCPRPCPLPPPPPPPKVRPDNCIQLSD